MFSLKKITKNRFFLIILCLIGYIYIRFVFLTSRVKIINAEKVNELKTNKQPMIFAFWHGHLLLMPCFAKKYKKISVITSHNRDGNIVSTIVKFFGVNLIRGSTSKGGQKAALEAVNILKSGQNLGITPDGPRGPRMKAAKGAVAIAKISACPIIPIGLASSRAKILNSWDKFIVTLPFSKIVLFYGNPIFVNKDEDEEIATDMLEKEMIKLTQQAETI